MTSKESGPSPEAMEQKWEKLDPKELMLDLGQYLRFFLSEKYDIGTTPNQGLASLERMGLDATKIQDEFDRWEEYLRTAKPVKIQGKDKLLLPPM